MAWLVVVLSLMAGEAGRIDLRRGVLGPANNPRPVPEVGSPSCGMDTDRACPLPTWNVTWDLAQSTAIGLMNVSGFFDAADAARWGLVSFDWNNGRENWIKDTPLDTEASMVTQCKMVKQHNPNTRCFVYRNTELALDWLSTQRAVMDKDHSGFFLKFQSDENGTAIDKCAKAPPCGNITQGSYCCLFGAVYAENNGWVASNRPGMGRQFFWDFRNVSLQSWWIDHFVLGQTGVNSPFVDGFFTDDVGGLPQEHALAIARMGYTPTETEALHLATARTWQAAMVKMVAEGGYGWQMFGNRWLTALPPSNDTCASRMRELCAADKQNWPMMMYGTGMCIHQCIH
jgi:hypothetical protein